MKTAVIGVPLLLTLMGGPASGGIEVEVETAVVVASRNDTAIPGDTGTKLSLVNDGAFGVVLDVDATATYALRYDGKTGVVNRCRKGSLQGKEASAEGRARVGDADTNAKRTPTIEASIYRRVLARVAAKGYPFERLRKTLQPAVAPASFPPGA